jgi:hypothetical protein
MAILIRFTPRGLTTEQYDAVGQTLQDSGAWPPPGLLAHVCFGSSGSLQVSEVWESREQQEQFAEKLMPAMQEANVDVPAEPEVMEVERYFFLEASSDSED